MCVCVCRAIFAASDLWSEHVCVCVCVCVCKGRRENVCVFVCVYVRARIYKAILVASAWTHI